MSRRFAPTLFSLMGFLALASPSRAQTTLGPVTVGAGLRTDFEHTDPASGSSVDKFNLNDIRLYVNGDVTDHIKFMFNTDYNGANNTVQVLDAAAEFSASPGFNIWAGRLLPPSDRANLAGPFYAPEWKVFTDAIQDGYNSVFQGRDNGIVYWGDFGKKTKLKLSFGAFDGGSLGTGSNTVLFAARAQLDFWDAEGGYYLNRTYYGDKNLLSIAGATQIQGGKTASTVDFLMEKKLPTGGAFTLEGEYANYNGFGGYLPGAVKSQGGYGLASYIFGKKAGVGKFQILGKFADAQSHGQKLSVSQKTTEVNVNYLIKQFNARVQGFYEDTRFNTKANPNFWQAGIGLQIQM
ncbi:MAG TPA: hypothetical protein VGN17_21465 [Bryobacteraceae bacterium]